MTPNKTRLVEAEEPYWLLEAEFSAEQRKQLAKKGIALPDGSFPIRNKGDLANAIKAFGRASDKAKAKAHIIKRAKALDATDMLPDGWISEAEQSLDEQSNRVRRAWRAQYRSPVGESNSYVIEVYPDHVVACIGEDNYSIPYSEKDDDIVFDTEKATKVERQWVTAEAASGSEFLVKDLSEADADPSGSRWAVRIIKAGTSKNRRRYSEKVLKEAASLFEGARVLARSDDEHIEGTNRSAKNVVGWITDVKFEKGALVGVLEVLESADWLRTMLLDAFKRGKPDIVGLSIVAEGRASKVIENGQPVLDVEAITGVESVDVVYNPAAGGEIVKLVAADRKEGSVDPLKHLIETLKAAKAEAYRSLVEAYALLEGQKPEETVAAIKETDEDLATKLEEALKAAPEGKPDDKAKEKAAKDEKVTEAAKDKADETSDEDKIPAGMSRIVVHHHLSETKLPEFVQKKIAKRYEGKTFVEAELTETIKDELDNWAEIEKQGLVRSSSGSRVEVGVSEAQKGKAALDGFFLKEDVELDGEKVRRYRSFKEGYIDLTGDGARDGVITGQLPRTPSGRLGISEADNGRVRMRLSEVDEDGKVSLSEAIAVATFDQALGDSIRRAMVREYAEMPLDSWRPLVDIVPAADFRTNRRVRRGGYANLPGVNEAAVYGALTSPTDEEATYAVTKRGGTETISLEAIANDDVGVIRTIPRALARAAAQTLHEFVFQFLNANPNIYDGQALFRAGNNNIGTVALSIPSLNSARIRMRKQADMSNSKRLGLVLKHLWVPLELEQLAGEVTGSNLKPGTADNDVNMVRKWGIDYTVVDYWTDVNNWYGTAEQSQVQLIELAFYGSETPELFEQSNPQVGSMFDSDQLKYKIRHIYSGAVIDFRGFDGSLVA